MKRSFCWHGIKETRDRSDTLDYWGGEIFSSWDETVDMLSSTFFAWRIFLGERQRWSKPLRVPPNTRQSPTESLQKAENLTFNQFLTLQQSFKVVRTSQNIVTLTEWVFWCPQYNTHTQKHTHTHTSETHPEVTWSSQILICKDAPSALKYKS